MPANDWGLAASHLAPDCVVEDGLVAHQVEYWPAPYHPRPGREDLAQPIRRIP